MPEKPPTKGADSRFLALPDERPPKLEVPAQFSFANLRRSPGLVWLAGHGPNLRKQPPDFDYLGKIGVDLTEQQGYEAARLVGLNLLVSLRSGIGSLDGVASVLQLVVMVNSAPSFAGQSTVANGCSDLMVEVFQQDGKPARMAFGVAELPFNMAVEASMVLAIK